MKHTVSTAIRIGVLVILLTLVVIPMSAIQAGSDQALSQLQARAIANLRIRSGPGTEYDQIGSIPFGTIFTAKGRNEAADWLFIEYNQIEGWVAGWYTTVYGDVSSLPVHGSTSSPPQPPPPASGVTATTTVDLRMRSGPGTSYDALGFVPYGTTVPVLNRNEAANWLYVSYAGREVWIAAWYTEISGSLNSVPTPGNSSSQPTPSPTAPPPTAQPPAAQVTATTQAYLRMRSGPGTEFDQVGLIPVLATVGVQQRNADSSWLLVAYDNTQGWIAAWYTVITGNLQSAPVAGGDVGPIPGEGPPYTVHLSNVGPHLRAIYALGQSLGNNPHAFSKVGDSDTYNESFLQTFDLNTYVLGQYAYLERVIQHFKGSFLRLGPSAGEGYSSAIVLSTFWADPRICEPEEFPLVCEYRLHRPSIAIIMLRSDYTWGGGEELYLYDLDVIVKWSLEYGVIPVLSTLPDMVPPLGNVGPVNEAIRSIAAKYNVPLWDLQASTHWLPSYGVDETSHLTSTDNRFIDSDESSWRRDLGMHVRNLQTLEVLDILLNEVIAPD
nr:SH3 domain-containing protein [Anaerolineae bacterium]